MDLPVVFQYQRALDQFRREGWEPPLLKRMSELISLLDLTTTLGSSLSGAEILDAALLIVMGELQASRGCLFVRGDEGYLLRASRGLSPGGPRGLPLEALSLGGVVGRGSGHHRDVFDAFGLEVLCPILKAGQVIAAFGLGPRAGGASYSDEEAAFLRSAAACAATPIENGLIQDELRRVNQRLSVKVFQLRNLFDISRELTASFDEESIENLTAATVMGHLMVSRCALYLADAFGLGLAHERGLRSEDPSWSVAPEVALPVLGALGGAMPVGDLPPGPVRERLLRTRMALAVPLYRGSRAEGILAVGERVSGMPFTEEDRDFALTLGRQAMAALEGVRLHRVEVEKQRQDRELQIAREIQRSLFPRACPRVPGFEVAAESHACYQVGGDHYDFIPLPQGKLALAVADVSGKGTPASLLMASVHASLRALAGTAPLPVLMERLNSFLYESTQANKYVTLFYAEVDPATHSLVYVNAGHVPPYWITAGGVAGRLTTGGPVLGVLEEARYEEGETPVETGDLVAVVTDGVTEALSPGEVEFGDERIIATLEGTRGRSAAENLRDLLAAVHAWTGLPGSSDDLTALVLRAL